jgi:hypothetical protein
MVALFLVVFFVIKFLLCQWISNLQWLKLLTAYSACNLRRKRKMQIFDKKTTAILAILLLTTSMSATLMLTQTVTAHTPPWTIVSYAYLVASPNPVGMGQSTAIVMWIDTPMVGATVTNDIRRHDYTLTITTPSGHVETKHWDIVTDSTSVQYLQYTPT